MTMESRIGELAAKVEKLSKGLVASAKENARLRRLLLSAESKIRELANAGNGDGLNMPEMSRQMEKMKNERKAIKEKVEKMALKLEKFYQE
jgi:hypothetical protein